MQPINHKLINKKGVLCNGSISKKDFGIGY